MRRTWLPGAFAVLATVVLAGAYVAFGDGVDLEWLRAVPAAIAAGAAAFVAVRWRPVRPVPWWVLSAGFATMVAATLAQGNDVRSGAMIFPGDHEAILLLAYPALFAGILGLTSTRSAARDLLAGSEPIIYTIALTALVWVAVSGPHFDDEGFPLDAAAWVWVIPLLDGALATLSVRRMRGPHGPRRYELLTLGFLAHGAGQAVTGWAAYDHQLQPGSWEAVAPMLGLVLIGAAMLAPDPTRDADAPPRVHWMQIFGLLFAALVPLGALLLMLATGLASRSSSIVVSVATVAVIVLALIRMWWLVDHVKRMSEERGRDRLAAMVEHSSDVVLLADVEGRVNYASPGLRAMLGYDPESWVGRRLTDVVVEAERDEARHHVDQVIGQGHGTTVEFEATLAHLDGRERRATVVVANLVGGKAVDGIVVTIRDVTEQRNLERQLSHRAFHDELTGLANRALFLDRMDHALRVARSDVDPVVVLFVDLDDFKVVNDQYGHATGDQVLKGVADRIRRAAGSGDTTARLGGDEFALLLEDRGGVDRAIDVAERLLEALRLPLTVGGDEITVLASVGVAIATAGMSTTSLLRDADIAMYEAKRSGKGQIRIFDPAMRLVATKHLEYRGDLAGAIERHELRLVYQPYVELSTGQVVGAEALVRWQHPEHGEVVPAQFVPVAERSGLIVPIGYWVIEQALEQAARWRAGLLIGVNVSVVQVRQPDFGTRLVDLVDEYRVDPSSVVLELNESAFADVDDRISASLERVRAEGFRFAVDDFGSGSCSLATLQRRPVDLLKIDRVAVHEFGDDPVGPSIARTILQTASSLGIATVAEGIETTAQLRELRRQGCTFGQGYLLSRPLDAAELERRFGHPDRATIV